MADKTWLIRAGAGCLLIYGGVMIWTQHPLSEIQNREAQQEPHALFVEVERLVLDNETNKATTLLTNQTFGQQSEIDWLIRMAYYEADQNPEAALSYLDEALKVDSENFDIRLHRAELQEAQNRELLALQEYEAASRLQPKNLAIQEKLASLYFKNQLFNKALNIWKSNLKPPTSDVVWLKVLFLSRLSSPVDFDWNAERPPPGKLRPLIKYLLSLEPNEFWNTEKFQSVPEGQKYLESEQSTYWLRLLEALRHNDAKEALTLLENNPFESSSWNPRLELALKRIFAYQKTRSFDLPKTSNNITQRDTHHFFEDIEQQALIEKESGVKPKIPPSLHELLVSKEVFAAALLAAGWDEAALSLHTLPIYPETFPNWVAVDMARALSKNRDYLDAIQFAYLQPKTDQLETTIGEFLIVLGNPQLGLEKLESITSNPSENASRAAWLVALYYLERKDYEKAKSTVMENSELFKMLKGKEILARISHYQNDLLGAVKIYTSIENDSPEAKSYLARKAFEDGNWNRAAVYTQQLIKLYPERVSLKENLETILKAQEIETSLGL